MTLSSSRFRRFIGTRSFYRQVLLLLIPVIIQNSMTNLVNLLDNLMVGAIGTVPMSAVAIVNQLLFVLTLCIFGSISGPSIYATQFAGAGDSNGVRHCFRIKLWICAIVIIVSIATFLIIPDLLIKAFLKGEAAAGDIDAALQYAHKYLRIMLIGLPPFALSMIYATTLRELGETRMPMFASVVALIVNLVFNYLLIFGKFGFPRLGVSGAAVATVISRFVEFTLIAAYTHLNTGAYPFIQKAYSSLHVPLTLLSKVAKRGLPLMINELLWAAGISAIVQCYSLRGLHIVAANTIAMNAITLFNCVFYSMSSAVSVIIGQELGANHFSTIKNTAWQLVTISLAISLTVATMLFIVAPYIPLFYNTEADVRQMASSMMRIFCIITPFLAVTHCIYFTIRAGGRSMITFWLDSGFTWLCIFPVSWYIGKYTDIPVLPFYFLSRGTEIIKTLIALAILKSGIWMKNIVS